MNTNRIAAILTASAIAEACIDYTDEAAAKSDAAHAACEAARVVAMANPFDAAAHAAYVASYHAAAVESFRTIEAARAQVWAARVALAHY